MKLPVRVIICIQPAVSSCGSEVPAAASMLPPLLLLPPHLWAAAPPIPACRTTTTTAVAAAAMALPAGPLPALIPAGAQGSRPLMPAEHNRPSSGHTA